MSKKKFPGKNEFFDINKLPSEKGLLLFLFSMNKLTNRQNARNCLRDIKHFSPSKVVKPLIGLNFIYSDYLYFHDSEKASSLKELYMNVVCNHKNSLKNLIWKNHVAFQIQNSFNYMVWNQLYLGLKNFDQLLNKIKKIYSKDKNFQKYLKLDCRDFNKKPTKNQINFFLEESLMMYLLAKNEISLPNEFIDHEQRWILLCYPGKPIRSLVYLFKLNPLNLNWKKSKYQNSYYDLENKQLIEMDRVDLESYSLN